MTKEWNFEQYTVYDEREVLRFETNEGELLGHVAIHDDRESIIDSLNDGADPMEEHWEDGIGNTITIDGWGNR